MVNAKPILFFLTQIFCVTCFAQRREIDSIKNVLFSLKDTSRIDCLNELSFQYTRLLIRDSAEYFESLAHKESEKINYIHGIAEAVSNQAGIVEYFDNDFIKAENLARKSLALFEKTNNKKRIANTNINLTFAVFAQSKYDEAYAISLKQYEIDKAKNNPSEIMSDLQSLGVIHFQQGNYDSAFYFNQQAQQLAITSKNNIWISDMLYSFGTLYKAIGKKILIAGVIIVLLLMTIIFRNAILKRRNEKQRLEHQLNVERLENEKKQTALQQQSTQLELHALRAQMNPHFIFNCLNSINRFIINNDAAKAADYLTKFAKLIRIVLEQSGKSFITLEDEICWLRLYMDLEALRFEKPFQYKIDLNGTDASSVMIPTMLIQPFVENAIWHGLHPKQNGIGEININMHQHDSVLQCSICDNGVGVGNSNQNVQANKKSLGVQVTQQRLQLFNTNQDELFKIKVEQLKNEDGQIAGTCVSINIPYKND